MRILTKIGIIEIFLEILSQIFETHLSYHYNIKMDCFGTKKLPPTFLLLNVSLAKVPVPIPIMQLQKFTRLIINT